MSTLFFVAAGGLAATVATGDSPAPGLAAGDCDSDGVGVAYDVTYRQSAAAFVVDAVRLTDVAPKCAGATARVALRDANATELAAASGPADAGTTVLSVAGQVRAADVVEVSITLAGTAGVAGSTPPGSGTEAPQPPPTTTTTTTPAIGFSPICNPAVSPGAICLFGGSRPGRLVGGAGRDLLVAGPAGDVLLGRGNADYLRGGQGRDRIAGGPGNDVANGLGGADRLYGGTGDDRLAGGTGNDVLDGGPGRDVLDGGPGRDVCRGGPGTDRFVRCEVVRP